MNQPDTPEIQGIHRLPLWGAFAVAALAMVLVVGSVLFGVKPVGFAESPVETERLLLFRDGANGHVIVADAASRQKLASFGKGEGAFVRISMRSMARQRISRELDLLSPYKLVKTQNGNLYIVDPQSDHKIRINAFGSIAINSFSQFLERDYSEKGAEG